MVSVTLAAIAVAIVSSLYAVNAYRRTAGSRGPEPASAGVPDGWRVLEMEMRRARRHGRTLTLNRIVAPQAGPEDLATAICRRLRTTDVCFTSGPCVYVAMPEASCEQAMRAISRLCRPILSAGGTCKVETATYPHDALTTEALVEHFRPLDILVDPSVEGAER